MRMKTVYYNFGITNQKIVKDSKNPEKDFIEFEGVATIDGINRNGNNINIELVKKGIEDFKKNPIVLFQHNTYDPIGICYPEKWRFEGKKWIVAGKVTRRTSVGYYTANLMEEKILRSLSIGAEVSYDENDELEKINIMEISVVSIPASTSTLITLINSFSHKRNKNKKMEMITNMAEEKPVTVPDKKPVTVPDKNETPEEVPETAPVENSKEKIEELENKLKGLENSFNKRIKEEFGNLPEYRAHMENEKEPTKIVNASVFASDVFGTLGEIKPSRLDGDKKMENSAYIKSTKDIKLQMEDIRNLLNETSKSGGPGTAGYGLAPIYPVTEIVDWTRIETPTVDLLASVPARGPTYDFNAMTHLNEAVALGEDPALNAIETIYDRKSVKMKSIYAPGTVTIEASLDSAGFIDIGAIAITNAMKAMRRKQNRLILNSTTNPLEFNGLEGLLTTNVETISGGSGGGASTLSMFRRMIVDCRKSGGFPRAYIVSLEVEKLLKDKIETHQRFVNTTSINYGIEKLSIDGIIVVPDRMCPEHTAFLIDLDSVFMAVRQADTFQPIASNNLSTKFTIFARESLVVSAEQRCAVLKNIRS